MFQSLRTELIVTEIEFQNRDLVSRVQGLPEVHAAQGSDLVDLELELFDCFGSLHVLANVLQSFIISFEFGQDDNLQMFVAALL